MAGDGAGDNNGRWKLHALSGGVVDLASRSYNVGRAVTSLRELIPREFFSSEIKTATRLGREARGVTCKIGNF